jgi:HEAT repeat protein
VPLAGSLAGSSLDEDVALLKSRDFVARSQAAERLVSAGAPALPVLGRAGDFAAPGPGVAAESTTRPVVDAILARFSPAEVEALLASPWPLLRRGAADELGRRGDWAPVPRLIDRLEDDEPQVRDAAHAALRRLTQEFPETGYGRGTTASLAERWRTWWRQEGSVKAVGRPGVRTG